MQKDPAELATRESSNQLNGVKVSSIVVNPLDEPKPDESSLTRLLFAAVHDPAVIHHSGDGRGFGPEDSPLHGGAAAVGIILGIVGPDFDYFPAHHREL